MLSTISYAGGTIDTRTYDAGGRLSTETLGNGQVVNRTYLTGDNLPLAISNSAVGNYTYAWDANKNKTGETIAGAMANYGFSVPTNGYDDQNRLTAWNRTDGLRNQTWTLSAVNDWISFTDAGTTTPRTHGPTHEILTIGAAAITHDSRGNMTTDELAITRTYDWNNKVSQAVVPTGSVRGIVGTHDYQYDALGRRVRKTIGGGSPSDTVFVHLGEQIYADYTAGAAATSPDKKYVWGSYIDELVCQAAGSSRLYPHRNQQYSTVALTDQSGTVTERYAYTSYGDVLVLNAAGTFVLSTPPQTRYTYTGREYDHEACSYHFRSRLYSASLGRFIGRDSLIYPDEYNSYADWFSPNNVDPSGMSPPVMRPRIPLIGLLLWELAYFKAVYPSGWDYLTGDDIRRLRGNLFDLSNQLKNCGSHPDASRMSTAVGDCLNNIMGRWEEGKIDIGTDADAIGQPADTQTLFYNNGLGAGPDIFLKNKFWDDSRCDRKRVLIKECYRRVALNDRDNTGLADSRNDNDFQKVECCTKCCGTTVPSEGKNGPEGCCPKKCP